MEKSKTLLNFNTTLPDPLASSNELTVAVPSPFNICMFLAPEVDVLLKNRTLATLLPYSFVDLPTRMDGVVPIRCNTTRFVSGPKFEFIPNINIKDSEGCRHCIHTAKCRQL